MELDSLGLGQGAGLRGERKEGKWTNKMGSSEKQREDLVTLLVGSQG